MIHHRARKFSTGRPNEFRVICSCTYRSKPYNGRELCDVAKQAHLYAADYYDRLTAKQTARRRR